MEDRREMWAGNFGGGGRKNRRKNGKTSSKGGGLPDGQIGGKRGLIPRARLHK